MADSPSYAGPGRKQVLRPSASAAILALVVLACGAFIGVEVSRIFEQRTEIFADAKRNSVNLTSSLLQQAELTFRTADALLLAVLHRIEHSPLDHEDLQQIKSWLVEEVRRSSQFVSFTVIAADAQFLVGSTGEQNQANYADREFFVYHRDHADRALRISAPVKGKLTNEWQVPVTRRIDRPDGSFGGVIVASIRPTYFQDLYNRLDIGNNGAILLAALNGPLLARRPFVEANIGRDMSQSGIFKEIRKSPVGTVEIVASTDGVRRFNSYEVGKTYPIVVAVAHDVEEMLAPWRESTARRLWEAAAIVIVMLVLGAVIWRTTRRVAIQAEALRQTNSRFRAAIEAMPDGLFLFDADKKLVMFNRRIREYYAYAEGRERPDMPLSELLELSAQNGLTFHPDRAQETMKLPDGRIMAVRRAPTPDGGWLSIHQDITERERATQLLDERLAELTEARNHLEEQRNALLTTTQELLAAKDAAEAADRAKSDFLAIMSHEIRTPMAGMVGMIDLMAGTQLDAGQRELAGIAQVSARNLLTVLNDVLDFSKLEAGQVQPEAIDFDLSPAIQSVTALLRGKAEQRGIALGTSIAPDMPPVLNGDPSRVSQVLLNLVSNAIKFTEQGGEVHISASYRALPGEAGELRIEVRDSGVGIPEKAQKSLFRPFMQADTSVSRKYGGTGLGLAICKRLCEAMGGTIDVRSRVGEGSTFWFTVRCGIGATLPVLAPPLAPEPAPSGDIAILVAEDNDIIRTLIAKLLARRGYAADLVCNGKEAVAAVSVRRYDLVLMDMQMPEMDGLTATRAIRDLRGTKGQVPVIALTANALPGQRDLCLAAGMSDFLTKPIQPDALFAAILRWGAKTAPAPDVDGRAAEVENLAAAQQAASVPSLAVG